MSLNQPVNENQDCIKVNVESLDSEFELCTQSTGVLIRHKGKEVLVEFKDFENPYALRAILDQEFDYDVKDPISGRIAEVFQGYINQLLEKLKNGEEYEICIKYKNGECDGEYIVANKDGIFIKEITILKKTGEVIEELKLISSLRVKRIQTVKFNGIFDVDFGSKFVKIETYNGEILTGTVDELTTLIKSRYGLEQQEKFKFLLNQDYETVPGFYAVGVWFDGEKVSIATESLYNPAWKKVDKYKLPPDIPAEKKKEVLQRILATVQSFKDPSVVTWILSFSTVANFAHYLRQKVGYFPHTIIVGKQKTGKTTLTVLNQYLFWGNNPLPPLKPKTEPQLRQLLSQSTLLTPIEEWAELASDNAQVDEMINSLHSSAQRFVLKRISTSNPDVNGTFLSLSSILADTNFTQEIDTASLDKIIFIKMDKEEGIDVKKAQEYNALLKNELKGDYYLHDILHTVGMELIQIVAEKLKSYDFNKERAELLNDLIYLGYMAWVDVFRKYGITLTPTVDTMYVEFPTPELKLVETITDEDLNILFEEFINTKVKQIMKEDNRVPSNTNDLMRYGFYFTDDEIICNYGLISEFNKWLSTTKGLKQRPISRLISDLGLKKSSIRINGQLVSVFKLNSVFPSLSEEQ